MNENNRCSPLFHLLVPDGKWHTSIDSLVASASFCNFFRISSLASYVRVTTGAVLDLFKADNVAIPYSHTPGASQLARRQKEVLEKAGVRISVYEPFAPGLSDFTPLLMRVRDQGAQALLSDTFFAITCSWSGRRRRPASSSGHSWARSGWSSPT